MVLDFVGLLCFLWIGWFVDWEGVYFMESGILDVCFDVIVVLDVLGYEIVLLLSGFVVDVFW